MLKSLEAVEINRLLRLRQRRGAPRAVLVAGASPKVDATAEAIGIARALVARREQIVLIDLARGPSAISGPLGISACSRLERLDRRPRWLRRRRQGRCRDGPLQVIAAGNPKLAASGRREHPLRPGVRRADPSL